MVPPGEGLGFLNIEIDLLLQQLPLKVFTFQFRLLEVLPGLDLQERDQLVVELTEVDLQVAANCEAASLLSAKRLFPLNVLPEDLS